MRKLRKKQVIVSFVLLVLLFGITFLIHATNKKPKTDNLEIATPTNLVNNTQEVINNELDENYIIEDTVVDNTEVIPNVPNEEKEVVKPTTEKPEVKAKLTNDKPTSANYQDETKQTQEIVNTPTTPTTNNNTHKVDTPSVTPPKQEIVTPQDTIKRITEEQLKEEISKYANDIKTIKPGLKYSYSKRGQVFWPYRMSEITIAVGDVSFGTIYYYVEKFVEGNEEKFRYYIDWDGN